MIPDSVSFVYLPRWYKSLACVAPKAELRKADGKHGIGCDAGHDLINGDGSFRGLGRLVCLSKKVVDFVIGRHGDGKLQIQMQHAVPAATGHLDFVDGQACIYQPHLYASFEVLPCIQVHA